MSHLASLLWRSLQADAPWPAARPRPTLDVLDALRTRCQAFMRRLRWRHQVRILSDLDDTTLHDVGLTRAEIGSHSAEIVRLAPPTRRRVIEDPWSHPEITSPAVRAMWRDTDLYR